MSIEESDGRNMMRWLRKNALNIVLALVMLAGASLLAYPAVSNAWNSYHQTKALAGYANIVHEMPEKDYSDYLEAARAYNAKLANGQFKLQSEESLYQEYLDLLNPAGNGMMGRIKIRKIDVDLPLYHGTEDNVLQVAVGHLYGSSLPVGGESTHACLSGHTGLPRAMLFTDLTELTMGDTFTIQVFNELLTYEVDKIDIVEPSDVSGLQIETGSDYVTLITCTPYGVNSHRLLVRGHRIENLPEDEAELVDGLSNGVKPAFRLDLNMLGLVLLGLIVLGLLVFLLVSRRKRKRRATSDAAASGSDFVEVSVGANPGEAHTPGACGVSVGAGARSGADIRGENPETAHMPETCDARESPEADSRSEIAAGPVTGDAPVAPPRSSAQARLDAELDRYAARMRARREALGDMPMGDAGAGPGANPEGNPSDGPGQSEL